MTKTDFEIAADLTQELIKARATVVTANDTTAAYIKSHTENFLTAEEVAKSYETILAAVRRALPR